LDNKSGYDQSETCLRKLRRSEIETVKNWFAPNIRILEIGGGSGYQASLLASYGCTVSSIDLENRGKRQKTYFPVQGYDGRHIPFESASFDLVFSSNVLEHVQNLPGLFIEIRRVLKADGKMIHILPSASWRFWTSLAHYIYVLRFFFRRRTTSDESPQPSLGDLKERYSCFFLIKSALFSGPHGEYPNAFSELYYFSKYRWCRLFKKNHCEIVAFLQNDLFYTGYGLFPGLSLEIRKKLASYLGASCHIFVMDFRSFRET